jgi:hypothetical protein
LTKLFFRVPNLSGRESDREPPDNVAKTDAMVPLSFGAFLVVTNDDGGGTDGSDRSTMTFEGGGRVTRAVEVKLLHALLRRPEFH